jgi:hypothetical protein
MQAAGSSTLMLTIYEAMWCHIPKDNHYGHQHGNFKSPNLDEWFG